MRIGAVPLLKIRNLEKVNLGYCHGDDQDIYKIIVYKGDREEYSTFCTPECAKEIDLYLEYGKRRGENITDDSYLIVKKFSVQISLKSKP